MIDRRYANRLLHIFRMHKRAKFINGPGIVRGIERQNFATLVVKSDALYVDIEFKKSNIAKPRDDIQSILKLLIYISRLDFPGHFP